MISHDDGPGGGILELAIISIEREREDLFYRVVSGNAGSENVAVGTEVR